MDYRDKLKHLRIVREVEQRQIASICGTSPQAVSNWENHRAHISVESLAKLCDFYKVSCNYILGLPEYPAPKDFEKL